MYIVWMIAMVLALMLASVAPYYIDAPANRQIRLDSREGWSFAPVVAGRMYHSHIALRNFTKATGVIGEIVLADIDAYFTPSVSARDDRFAFFSDGSRIFTWIEEDRPDVLKGAVFSHSKADLKLYGQVGWYDGVVLLSIGKNEVVPLPPGLELPAQTVVVFSDI